MRKVKRKVTPVITRGVADMNLPITTSLKIVGMAVDRWKADPSDYFTRLTPDGIIVEISNGNEVIEQKLVSDFPGLSETVYVIVDDYGEDSEEGLVVIILLPNEY